MAHSKKTKDKVNDPMEKINKFDFSKKKSSDCPPPKGLGGNKKQLKQFKKKKKSFAEALIS